MNTRPQDMPDSGSEPFAETIQLTAPGPFSFSETMAYLTRSPHECMYTVIDGRRIRKLLKAERETVLVEIGEGADGAALSIRWVDSPPLSRAARDAVVRYVREWLDLDTDMTPFYRMAEGDALLGGPVRDHAGLRLAGIPDLFEALCWAVIGQQINLTFAYMLKKRLVETFGRSMTFEGRPYWLFPRPEEIAATDVADWKKLQFTGKKAEYIIGIARLMESGALSKEQLLSAALPGESAFQAAERQLQAIRGIGPWSAHYVLMRCLRDRSAFPIGDAGLHNALKRLMNRKEKPELSEIRRLFGAYRGWEAYAVFYFWRFLQAAEAKPGLGG